MVLRVRLLVLKGVDVVFGSRFNLLSHTQETMYKDGINSLKTQVLSIQKLDLFTMITVDVGKQ